MQDSIKQVSPQEAFEAMTSRSDGQFIDVREPDEVKEIAATGFKNIPLSNFVADQLIKEKVIDPNRPIYIICRSGRRSQQAAVEIALSGAQEVYNISGGTLRWAAEGLPVKGES